MGTRGAWGFYKDGVTKATYNHYDSYPDALGETMLKFVWDTSDEKFKEIFDRIVLVEGTPTPEQLIEVTEWEGIEPNMNVGGPGEVDWYKLLRNVQGDPYAYKNGLRFMEDGTTFMQDSLFCEYAYIFNVEEMTLEFYIGWQKDAQKNRYYDEELEGEDYKNVKLVYEYAFDDIRKAKELDVLIAHMEVCADKGEALDLDDFLAGKVG